MHKFKLLLILWGAFLLGCGSESLKSESVTPVTPPTGEQAKGVLQGVAATGEKGSGVGDLQRIINDMKATDAAKAEALSADLTKLEAATDPAQIKSIAQKMLGEL